MITGIIIGLIVGSLGTYLALRNNPKVRAELDTTTSTIDADLKKKSTASTPSFLGSSTIPSSTISSSSSSSTKNL